MVSPKFVKNLFASAVAAAEPRVECAVVRLRRSSARSVDFSREILSLPHDKAETHPVVGKRGGGAVAAGCQYDPLRPARNRWAPRAEAKAPTETVPERIVLAPGM